VLDSLVDPVFTVILLSLYTFINKYHHQFSGVITCGFLFHSTNNKLIKRQLDKTLPVYENSECSE